MGDTLAHVRTVDMDNGAFAIRPDHATQATRILRLRANHFEMAFQSRNKVLYMYEMSFKGYTPKDPNVIEEEIEVPQGKKLIQVVRCALHMSQFDGIRSGIATDFGKKLISCRKLNNEQMQTGKFKFWAENEIVDGIPRPRKHAVRFQMFLEQRQDLCVSDLLSNLASGAQGRGAPEHILPIVQALDIIIGHHGKFSLEISTPKRGKCFSHQPGNNDTFQLQGPPGTPGYLRGVFGFFASVRATTDRTLVNCNACCGAFYKTGSLADLFRLFMPRPPPSYDQYKRLESAIQGLRVELTHLRDENQPVSPLRTIFGLAHPYRGPGEVEFEHEGDKRTYTVASYWAEKRNSPIPDGQLYYPVINVGNKDHPTFVPPHVCKIFPGQMARKKLDSTQNKDMIERARRGPEQITQSIKANAFRILGLEQNVTLNSFGISVKPEMVNVEGRALECPTVIYHNVSRPVDIDLKARWTMMNQTVVYSRRLEDWGVLRIVRDQQGLRKDQVEFFKAFKTFQDVLKKTIGAHKVGEYTKTWNITVVKGDEATLREAFEECERTRIKFLIIVLPDNEVSLYKQIKTFGDTKYGIISVCVLPEFKKFYSNRSIQYCANVALKINLKLGGTNHVIMDHTPLYKTTMVIGIDVTHPSPGKTKRTAPSVAAMVASVDDQLAQWPVDLRINTASKEMVDLLGPMLRTRLELWLKRNPNSLPENLLIYRDGVAESQYEAVLNEEVGPLRNTCEVIYAGRSLPKITLIIVGKRHHTRFFGQGKSGSTKNPPFGTVVDTGVTEARNWDFFLQSHHALMGTARPAHYFVLLNEIFTRDFVGKNTMISDYVQKMTYEMCYLFGRSTGPVSLPPPVYYAHLACERSRCYGDFDDDISDTSSLTGDDRGKPPVSQGKAQLPFRSRPGPSDQKPSAAGPSGSKNQDASRNQPRSTESKAPDLTAGLSKKERARLFEEKIAAASQRAAGSSSKAEAKPAEASAAKAEGKKVETGPSAKGKGKAEGKKPEAEPATKAEGKKPTTESTAKEKGKAEGKGKAPESTTRAKVKEEEDTQSIAQGKKPEVRAEEKKAEAGEKGKVEIHPDLVDTMFYI